MGYRAMTVDMLYNLYRRWAVGRKPMEISRQSGLHRSTVYAYIDQFARLHLDEDATAQEIRFALLELIPENAKPRPHMDILKPYAEEIRNLVSGKNGMKPKSAWEVIDARHELSTKVSYETFKRFYRSLNLDTPVQSTIRIEGDPGQEAQIDYGKMGTMVDRISGKRFVVQAFVGILVFSRLPFIQFIRTQTKPSFIGSLVTMLTFHGGVIGRLNLDNLKAGVIKADIWHPDLNRSLQECADHYGFFIDPCRVAEPTDKGKVERMVPVARELFRKLMALYPEEDLTELNLRALAWCRDEYGQRPHGTTGIAPLRLFLEQEQPALRPLPATIFELAEWGSAKVHPDQYIRFKSKMYSLPLRYIGETVQIRQRRAMVDIFHRETLVRSYVIPRLHRAYVEGDFPKGTEGRHDGSYAAHLIRRAEQEFGSAAAALIGKVLDVPANLTARRALGLLDQMRKHKGEAYLEVILRRAMVRGVDHPKVLEAMLDYARKNGTGLSLVPISQTGKEMIRDISYYAH